MKCHLPGTAWQKACSLPSGSTSGRSVVAKTTPEVPRVRATTPGRTAPAPTAPAAWSPPPATTGVPSRKPISAAALAVTAPVASGPSNVGGSHSAGMSSFASTSPDQPRDARSKSSVPEPSALSMAATPVRRRRT
jgi:hypothetical protein